MSCFRPISAHRSPGGEVRIGWSKGDDRWLELPCGRCIGCRMERAGAWKIRILHEAQLYASNVVVSLTYADDFLPRGLELEYPDFQGFMKRLRRRVVGVSLLPDGSRPVRFFCVGEYGGTTGRPHFHAVLFNVRFPDMVKLENGFFRSSVCEELWSRGSVVIDGEVTPEGAAYVAGYVLEKADREAAHVVDMGTGELIFRRREFCQMSRRPGVGAEWYSRFAGDLFPRDHAVVAGKEFKVPRYYLDRFKREADPGVVEQLLELRFARAREHPGESTPERRAVREVVAQARKDHYEARKL